MHLSAVHGDQLRASPAVMSCQGSSRDETQSKLPLIAAMHGAPKDAPSNIVRQVESEAMAVKVAMKMSGSKNAYVARCLGIDESYVSLIRNGKRPVPAWFVEPFCRVTGTNLLRQVRRLAAALESETSDEVARLADELRRVA
jgi:DNA-binding transcriptional regulator YdaS (Cro superfamily)